MNKKEILMLIIVALNENYAAAMSAVDLAHETATHKEVIADNKYDTFGLEASYLAHGQSKRVLEIEKALLYYRELKPISYQGDSRIGNFALVTLERLDTEEQSRVVIGAEAGGVKIYYESVELTIVTPTSPLGHALLGKERDDIVSLHITEQIIEYEIIDIL